MRQSSLTNIVNPQKMSRASDDILTAIQFMDECKQGQSDEIRKKLEEDQLHYKGNLIARLMLSNKDFSELKRHRDSISKMSLPQNNRSGKKEILYAVLFEYPLIMLLFRPFYRIVRSLHRQWDTRRSRLRFQLV